MFINTIQLLYEASEMQDCDIENDLASYFKVGYTELEEQDFEKTKKDLAINDVIQENSLPIKVSYMGDDILEMESEDEVTKSETVVAFKEKEQLENLDNVKIEDESKQHKNVSSVVNNENAENEAKIIAWVRWVSASPMQFIFLIQDIVCHLKDYSRKEVVFLKAFVEREQEYKYSVNLTYVLALIELLKERSKTLIRTQFIINKMSSSNSRVFFSVIKRDLSFEQKKYIDSLLKKANKEIVFYKGIIGFIKRLFHI